MHFCTVVNILIIALSELQEVLDRERGRADELQVNLVSKRITSILFSKRITLNLLSKRIALNLATLQVTLNDSETERESLTKRLAAAEEKAGQFDQVEKLLLK